MKKILIIGGVAGGASVAARLRRFSEEDEIVIFERGRDVSFSNCSLPYFLGGVVPNVEKLLMMTPEKFFKQYNIDVRVHSDVVEIIRDEKKIKVKDKLTNSEYYEEYDKLVLAPGADPIIPRIKGIEKISHFTVKNVEDVEQISENLKSKDCRSIAVIGGGFIGVETAENLKKRGYEVSLIEGTKQILKTFDFDMVQVLHKELYDNGVKLFLEDKVVEFTENSVIFESGNKVLADVVIMAVGIRPNIGLAKDAGLEIGKTGAIKVDQNYRTNDRDIYAIGDAIEVYNSLFNDYFKLSLAGPALKQARNVADHINGMRVLNRGYIGSSTLSIFECNCGATGLTEATIKERELTLDYGVIYFIHADKVSIMPQAKQVYIKLIYEKSTGRILGAQGVGKGDVVKRIDVIATVIKFGGTIDDLRDLELCYSPTSGTAKDIVNYLGYIGSNILNDEYKEVRASQVRDLLAKKAVVIDVREPNEFALASMKGSKNIPLSELRKRLDEIPKDQPVYISCKSSQRSYNACKVLSNLGYRNIFNIAGGFIGISFNEYFEDKYLERESILTGYIFN